MNKRSRVFTDNLELGQHVLSLWLGGWTSRSFNISVKVVMGPA